MPSVYTALIRTHHITSRKKVAKLRAATSNYNVYVLLRYGGCPGIMFCQGTESAVKAWVATVQRLRYKDFSLAKKPTRKTQNEQQWTDSVAAYGKLDEVDTVKEFGVRMQELGAWAWWRKGMGYVGED